MLSTDTAGRASTIDTNRHDRIMMTTAANGHATNSPSPSSTLSSRARRGLGCALRLVGRRRLRRGGDDTSSNDDARSKEGEDGEEVEEGGEEVEMGGSMANSTSMPPSIVIHPPPSSSTTFYQRPKLFRRAQTMSTTTYPASAPSSSLAAAPHHHRRPPPIRRTRSLTPSHEHYLISPINDGGCNAPLVPLSMHYDAADALLGLFVSSYNDYDCDGGNGGDASGLAYAVGTRFVEVALYRIPKHGYYRNGSEGGRRTRLAADAMWVTGLLGSMLTRGGGSSSTTTSTMMVSSGMEEGGEGDDDRIATLRKLALEARRSFEEALDDEGDVGRGAKRTDNNNDRSCIRHLRADDDVVVGVGVRTWREYVLGNNNDGGPDDRCYGDVMTCHNLHENICSFWNNVVVARAYVATTSAAEDDDYDRVVAPGVARTKRAKIDGDSSSGPMSPSGPIDGPMAFVGGEGDTGDRASWSERDKGDVIDDVDVAGGGSMHGTNPPDMSDQLKNAALSSISDVDDHGGRYPSPSNDELANDVMMTMDVDDPSIALLSPPSILTASDYTAVALVEDDMKEIKPAVVVQAEDVLQQHQHHRSVDSRGFDREVLRLALSLSMKYDGDLNVVSSSSSRSSGVVTDESLSGVIAGGNFESVESMSSLYREQYLALRDNGKFHVRFLDTYQGRNPQTTNGCTVIAPLTCVQYFTSSEQNVMEASPSVEFAWWGGIPDGLINHVIDEHAASILPDVRKKLRLEGDAFIIPSDVHDHLIEVGLLSTQQFVGVCGGNILDDGHLHAFKSSLLLLDDARERERLRGRKIAATFFFHGHVVALHVVNGKVKDDSGNAWIELIDSLPDPETWAIAHPSPSLSPIMSSDRSSQFNFGWSGAETDDEWEHGLDHDEGYELPLNAVRVRCTDIEHFDTLIRHYACSKFSEEERQFINGTAWEDNNGYCENSFDPRVFQAFIWAESE